MSTRHTSKTPLKPRPPEGAVCVICESPDVVRWRAAGMVGDERGTRQWFCDAHWVLSKRVMAGPGEALICGDCPLRAETE